MRSSAVERGFAAVDRLLQGSAPAAPGTPACLACLVAGGALHGAAMGGSSGEPLLALYAALKVPLLTALSTLLTLPLFYVLLTVLGLGDDLRPACRGLLAAQAALAVALGATAPLLSFGAVSGLDPNALTLFDGVLFAAATLGGQRVLARHYAPLIDKDPRHRRALAGWLVLYVFLAIQLAWVLRPFFGTPGFGVAFLRDTAWQQNAYVVLFEHVQRLFR